MSVPPMTEAAHTQSELTKEEARHQDMHNENESLQKKQAERLERQKTKQNKSKTGSDKRRARYAKAFKQLQDKGNGVVTQSATAKFLLTMINAESAASLKKKQKKDPTATADVNDIAPDVDDVISAAKLQIPMSLNIDDFIRVIKGIKLEKRTISQTKLTFAEMDENDSDGGGNGTVGIAEVAHHLAHIAVSEADTSNDSVLSPSERAKAHEAALSQMHKYIEQFDDGDGLITFPEFWELTRSQRSRFRIKEKTNEPVEEEKQIQIKQPNTTSPTIIEPKKEEQDVKPLEINKESIEPTVSASTASTASTASPSSPSSIPTSNPISNSIPTPISPKAPSTPTKFNVPGKAQNTYAALLEHQEEIGFDTNVMNTGHEEMHAKFEIAEELRTKYQQAPPSLRSLFDAWDTDKDGQLNAAEILELACAMHYYSGADAKGKKPNPNSAGEFVSVLDVDGSQLISWTEFYNWYMKENKKYLFLDHDTTATSTTEETKTFLSNFEYHLKLQTQSLMFEAVLEQYNTAATSTMTADQTNSFIKQNESMNEGQVFEWMNTIQQQLGDPIKPTEKGRDAIMKLLCDDNTNDNNNNNNNNPQLKNSHLKLWSEHNVNVSMLSKNSSERKKYLAQQPDLAPQVLQFIDGVNLVSGTSAANRAKELKSTYETYQKSMPSKSGKYDNAQSVGDGKIARRHIWELEREYHFNRPSSLHYLYDAFDTQGNGHYTDVELYHLANAIRQHVDDKVDDKDGNNEKNEKKGSDITTEIAKHVIDDLDEDGNGQLEYNEFRHWLIGTITNSNSSNRTEEFYKFEKLLAQDILDVNTVLMQRAIVEFYIEFDRDGNQDINANELLTWMSNVHELTGSRSMKPTLDIASKTIDFLDKNKNGTIEQNELLDWLREGQKVLIDPKQKELFRKSSGAMGDTILDFLDMVVLQASKKTSKYVDELYQNYYNTQSAAVKIQAMQRGKLERNDMKLKKEKQMEFDNQEFAATKIQAMQRGKTQRQKDERMKIKEAKKANKGKSSTGASTERDPEDTITATFGEGPIGIQFDQEGVVIGIQPNTQAEQIPELSSGDLLISINGNNVKGMTLKEMKPFMKTSDKDNNKTLIFERHVKWARNEQNGLPHVDYSLFQTMFKKHDLTKRNGLNAEEFSAFISQVHEMAVDLRGREKHEHATDTIHIELAQRLIDAHDDNDDGLLQLDEIEGWIKGGLKMGQEERKAYADRGGHFPTAVRLLEDTAHAFHFEPHNLEITFEIDLTKPLAMAITHPEEDQSHYPAVITQVHPNGQAEIAGIEIGMHIHQINGIDCKDKEHEWVIDLIQNAKKDASSDGKMIMICAKNVPPKNDEQEKMDDIDMDDIYSSYENTWADNASVLLSGTFDAGPLGLDLNHQCEIVSIKRDSQACKLAGLSKGDILVEIEGQSVRGLTLKQSLNLLNQASRPVNLMFQRHQEWSRDETNDLPKVNWLQLKEMHLKYEQLSSNDDNTEEGINAMEFAKMIDEIHQLSMKHQGRTIKEKVKITTLELSQRLIDAHDENDDGLLEVSIRKHYQG